MKILSSILLLFTIISIISISPSAFAETMMVGDIDVTLSPPIEGSVDATVTIIEFGDYQCPKCDEWFQNEKPTIQSDYIDTGKANLYFVDFAFLGDDSNSAAEAAYCAEDQGMYWEYHGTLYNNQGGINEGWASPDNLKQFAVDLGLDTDEFNTCLDSGKYSDRVSQNTSVGASHGVEGTPVFFLIGTDGTTERINGPQSSAIFADVIDSMLGEAMAQEMEEEMMETESMGEKEVSGTITSMVDPGVGHESHQLAILLAPSENVYSGTLTYSASEPIQLISLHGPLAEGEDAGQAVWTPDGETKFALTFVVSDNAEGEWQFAGNALAVHTMNTEPFTVDYQVDYAEKPMSDTVATGTTTSMTDPGIGHESHQIAILLAPSSDVYSGILSYSASENIQLITLRGPVGADETSAMTWTPDGETIFELTFVDPENAMGSWEFSGNALAVHTMNTDPFTVSYSVSATATAGEMMMEEDDSMMKEKVSRPYQQMKSGIEPQDVVCNEGLVLMLRSSDGSAVCVTESSSTKLLDMDWGTLE